MPKKYKMLLIESILTICIVLQMTGCKNIMTSAFIDTIIQEEQVETFYGESIQRTYIDEELIEEINTQEWKGKGNNYCIYSEIHTKKEYISEEITDDMLDGDFVLRDEKDVINGDLLTAYLPYKNEYYTKNLTLEKEIVEDISHIGISKALETGYLKDYVMACISNAEKDYNLSIEDDIKINGKLTQHVIATPKDHQRNERSEIWIDQSSWLIVKELVVQGNIMTSFEYTNFQLNPIINDKRFEMIIPSDAKVVQLEDGIEEINEVVTMNEVTERLGVPVYYLEASNKLKLLEIHYIKDTGVLYGRIEMTYIANDGSKIVVQTLPNDTLNKKLKLDYETIKVKGKEASYVATDSSQIIMLNNEESVCNIYTQNSNMSKAEFIKLMDFLEIKN